MIHNDRLRSRSHITPSKTNQIEQTEALKATQTPQENPEGSQFGSNQEDSAQLSQHATEESTHAAKLLEFADKPSLDQAGPPQKELSLKAFKDESDIPNDNFKASSERFKDSQANLNDPAVQELLDYIRDIEDQNVQALLDGLDESLKRAHQMMEENMKHFYDKIKPQMDQIKTEVKNMISETKQNQSTEINQAKSKLQALMQDINTQLSQAQGNPSLIQKVKHNLDLSQVLNALK